MKSISTSGRAEPKMTLVDASTSSQAPEVKLSAKQKAKKAPTKKPSVDLFPDVMVSQKTRMMSSVEDVRTLVNEMITQSFPELKDEKISVVARPFSDPLASFNSRPQIATLLPFVKTRYVIEVNENVFGRNMTEEIAKGYLAHELAHTVYYDTLGTSGVMTGLVSELGRMAFGYRFMAGWERATDLEAVERGYGAELKASFEWYLSFLTPEEGEKKLKRYLSPEEIGEAMVSPRDAPIWRDWRNNWPK